MLKTLETLSRRIDAFLQAVLLALSTVMLVVNLVQIAGRYLFFYSIPWSEELSTYMYVWIIFLALHMITREKTELTIDVLNPKNPRTMAKARIARDIVTLLTVAIFFVASVLMIRNAILYPRMTTSLGVTTAGLYLCMPIGFALVFLQRVTNLLRHIADLSGAK